MVSSHDRRLTSLPHQLSKFIGREREIAKVRELLSSSRLVTLTGASGIGKTRLALEAAALMGESYSDGVGFVQLGSLNDPALIPRVIASTLGVHEQAGQPLADVLAEALLDKHVLLIMDNCEHMIEDCAMMADRLCKSCPSLQILATSREALGVYGETTWPVPPLAVPNEGHPENGEELRKWDATRLFVDRALAAVPDMQFCDTDAPAIVEICRRLNGIPLAIELAAAHIKILSPRQIASRLDDSYGLLCDGSRTLPQRQRTMRTAVAWSYDLLPAQERKVFDRLSVFSGSFSLEAVERVCAGDGVALEDILSLVGHLVDKSLVVADLGRDSMVRYRVLELLRQYGAERLRESGRLEAARAAHAEFFLELAEQSRIEHGAPDRSVWQTRLEQEHDNLRAARTWFHQSDAHGPAARLAAAVRGLLIHGRHVAEGRTWLQNALGLPATSMTAETRMQLLHGAGVLAWLDGDGNRARTLLGEALALSDEVGDQGYERAHLLYYGGLVLGLGGDVSRACAQLTDAAAIAGCVENPDLEARILWSHAFVLYANGNEDAASAQAELLVTLATEAHLTDMTASALCLLGKLAFQANDTLLAQGLFERSIAQARTRGLAAGLAWSLAALAELVIEQGDFFQARTLLTEALEIYRDLNLRWGIAIGLDGFVHLAAAQSQYCRALRLSHVAAALWEAMGVARPVTTAARLDRYLEQAAQALGGEAVAARQKGCRMSPQEAISDALFSDEIIASFAGTCPQRAYDDPLHRLSRRERDVALLVNRGLSNREIAQELFISQSTVATHVWRILDKLGLRSRTLVAARLHEYGLR